MFKSELKGIANNSGKMSLNKSKFYSEGSNTYLRPTAASIHSLSPFKAKVYNQRTSSIKEEFAKQLKELARSYEKKDSKMNTRYSKKSHTPYKESINPLMNKSVLHDERLSQYLPNQMSTYENTSPSKFTHSKGYNNECEMVNTSKYFKERSDGYKIPFNNERQRSIEQYKNLVMRKGGVLNSSEQCSVNPLFTSSIEESNRTAKFSMLKDSDLAGSVSLDPIIPSVTPPFKPLVPSLGKPTDYTHKDISPFISNKRPLKMQELQSNKSKEKVCKSTELAKSTQNLYERYSITMEKGGIFGNNWYIPVQRTNNKYISLEGFELELHKTYTIPLKISKDGKVELSVYCTITSAQNEIEGTSIENKGLLRVHVTGSYKRIKLCKFVFSCITPIEFISS